MVSFTRIHENKKPPWPTFKTAMAATETAMASEEPRITAAASSAAVTGKGQATQKQKMD